MGPDRWRTMSRVVGLGGTATSDRREAAGRAASSRAYGRCTLCDEAATNWYDAADVGRHGLCNGHAAQWEAF